MACRSLWLFAAVCLYMCTIGKNEEIYNRETALRTALFGNRKPYAVYTRPSVHSNQSSLIEFGLALIQVNKLDAEAETLVANFWVRMVWYDYSLHWNDDDYDGLNVLRVSRSYIWTPDVVLTNSEVADSSAITPNTLLLVYPTGQVLGVPSHTFHSTCKVNLRNFPFDEHVCELHFQSVSHDGHSLKFSYYDSRKNIDLTDYWSNQEWKIIAEDDSDETPKTDNDIVFSLHLRRRGCYFVFTLGIPIVLTWALMLTLFWLPPTSGEKIIVGAYVMLYHVILLIYFQWIIPHNGSQVPRIVSFCSHSLIFAVISIILTSISVTMSRSTEAFTAPTFLKYLLTGWLGYLLCLGPSRKGVSLGAKLLTSSNIEININSEVANDSNYSGLKQPHNDWGFLAMALDRIFFIIYCVISISLILSFLYG